jgi:hypothetical protein
MTKFRDFESAREFVRSLGLKSRKEWHEYCKSNKLPHGIPKDPYSVYSRDKTWKSWGDWVGTGTVHTKQWRSFTDAREFVRKLGLKTANEWREYCKSGDKPNDISANPNTTYKKDFKGFGDWLGTGRIADQDKVFRPYKEAREFVRKLNLKNHKEWIEYCTSGNKPDDIPSSPVNVYKNEYVDLGDWLGTGNISNRDKVYRPFKEAREFVQKLGLNSKTEWLEYCKSGNKPDDIPSTPWDVYKEWKKK